MKATDREQARRIGAYIDHVVTKRRATHERMDALSPDDREFEELSVLARRLHTAQIVAPTDFREALANRLRAAASTEAARLGFLERVNVRRKAAAVLRLPRVWVTCGLVLIGVLWFSPRVMDLPVASAESVLHRADAALTSLVGPGEILYRRWRVRSSGGAGAMTGTPQPGRIIEEWMDGINHDRVAARWWTLDGQLQVAYTTVESDEGLHPHVYFSPGVYGEAKGLLNIEPSRVEFDRALGDFSPLIARSLRVYLDRHYIYAPIRGEREYNHAIFAPSAGGAPEMPRVVVSYDTPARLNAAPVYRVRLLDSASVTFNWRSTGPSAVRIAQAEIVRYISQDSFLSLRTEERFFYEDGRRRESVRELERTDVLRTDELSSDPFVLEVPSDTPIKRQSAVEHLNAVADALRQTSILNTDTPKHK